MMMAVIEYGHAQCSTIISSFSNNEGFETNEGGWQSGGTGNDWAWVSVTKAVITTAAGGSKCWVIGRLTVGSYTDGNLFVWYAVFKLPGKEKEFRKGVVNFIG
jgi:hypothetical protein